MLFNSIEFITWFLPCTVVGFFLLGHWRLERFAIAFLILASLFFYAWWRIEYLPLLIGSIVFNYGIGRLVAERRNRWILALGIAANLSVLGYFKYSLFVLDNVNLAFGTSLNMTAVLLPLGISFFTFQQIAYLVDAYDGVATERNFLNYALFVSFFPQLIAGPIVHHKEMLPQFQERKTFAPSLENLAIGLTIFSIGLFKKVVIADRVANYSTHTFDATASGYALTFFEAWGGAGAFTLQLYFDFSGYSDMAVGLGCLFGIRLPINFNSPYKAASIIEFWQRWHITLTRFLTAYVYNPVTMALTRRRMAAGKSLLRRGAMKPGPFVVLLALPTLFTMFLAGIWHGAGFQFIIFGVLHGVYLVINHAWRAVRGPSRGAPQWLALITRPVCVVVTFLAVVVSLVFFRAESVPHAMAMLSGMAGLNGIPLPQQFSNYLGPALPIVASVFDFRLLEFITLTQMAWLGVLMLLVWVVPNTYEWVSYAKQVGEDAQRTGGAAGLANKIVARLGTWRPNTVTGVLVGSLICFSLLDIISEAPSEFLYFNF